MTPGMLIAHGAVSRRLRNLAQSRSSLYAASRSPAQGKRETAGTDRYGRKESSDAKSIEPPWVVAPRRDPRGRVPAPHMSESGGILLKSSGSWSGGIWSQGPWRRGEAYQRPDRMTKWRCVDTSTTMSDSLLVT